jgi:ligand-binding SRPBCC domain-containing protein
VDGEGEAADRAEEEVEKEVLAKAQRRQEQKEKNLSSVFVAPLRLCAFARTLFFFLRREGAVMPVVRFVERYPLAPAAVFAFFRRPANVVAVAPAGFDVRLVAGPQEPSVGQTFSVQVRRFGLSRLIETAVVTLQEPSLIVERQMQGPFRDWVVERRFAEEEGETELTETVSFQPPGGMLGLMMTASAVEAELGRAYQGRVGRVMARLGGRSPDASPR